MVAMPTIVSSTLATKNDDSRIGVENNQSNDLIPKKEQIKEILGKFNSEINKAKRKDLAKNLAILFLEMELELHSNKQKNLPSGEILKLIIIDTLRFLKAERFYGLFLRLRIGEHDTFLDEFCVGLCEKLNIELYDLYNILQLESILLSQSV